MDDRPDPDEIPADLLAYLHREDIWEILCHEWDRKYPNNPVHEQENEEQE